MKKILSILGALTLIGTSTTSLVACDKPDNNGNGRNNEQKESKPKREEPPGNSNWKLIPRINDVLVPPIEIAHTDSNRYYVKEDDRKYIVIYGDQIQKWKIIKTDAKSINKIWAWSSRSIIYYWDNVGEPELPTIDKNTGKITDWK